MAIYVAKSEQLQTVKGIYYGMTEDYINATLFHNLVPKTATEIQFLYASDNPDLTGYQKLGYADNNNFIEVWNNGTKYILINPRKNYIYAPVSCSEFLRDYTYLTDCVFDNFDTRYSTDFFDCFYGCNKLTSVDISMLKFPLATRLQGMFFDCNRLVSVQLPNFPNVKNCAYMFVRNFALSKIYANSFRTTGINLSIGMFDGCYSIVGGNGTTYSSSHINAEYARVDGEDNLPGYFTAPTN